MLSRLPGRFTLLTRPTAKSTLFARLAVSKLFAQGNTAIVFWLASDVISLLAGFISGFGYFARTGRKLAQLSIMRMANQPAASEYDDAGLADALKKFEDLSKAEEIPPAAATPAATPEYKNER
jgi:hypothetical protein